jgi:hypothetical protein
MKNKSRKNSLIATAALSLLLGVQVAAFATPYNDGWIIGSLCVGQPTSCMGGMCFVKYAQTPSSCDWAACINGARDYYNQTHNPKLPQVACVVSESN